MELEAASPVLMRRDGRKLARCPRLQLDTKTVTAIEQSTGESQSVAADAAGAMRVKIVLSKQQLKQVAAAITGGGVGGFALPPALEQLVSVLKRQQYSTKKQAAADVVAAAVARRGGRWSPALHSIRRNA
ncbi:unnamed protein product [Urochloa humidicola]